MTEADKATARYWSLVNRYNKEWREGRWFTNRELAGACEDAYDAMIRARGEG